MGVHDGRSGRGAEAGVSRRPVAAKGLDAFRALGASPLGVADIGSRGGAHPIFREVAPLLEVVGFEPDAEECQRLQAEAGGSGGFRSLTYLPCALGETDRKQVLQVSRSRGASSFYAPNRALLDRFPDAGRFDVVATASVPVRSLDSLLADPEVPMPRHLDFIKVDTQGSELEILRGARRTLDTQVVGVEVEVEFARLYVEQPLFRDIDAFLEACGFTLFKLRRQEWVRRSFAHRPHLSAGQLVFGDALYLRDPLAPGASWRPQDGRQAETLILLALLYDLHDFALELLDAPHLVGGIDAERLRRCVVRRSRRLQSFVQRLRVAKALLSGGERFTRYAWRWSRGDDHFYSAA